MRYVSTRGKAPEHKFLQILLSGLGADGGLYLPESWPLLTAAEIAAMAGQTYEANALTVMRPFGTPVAFAKSQSSPVVSIGSRRYLRLAGIGPEQAVQILQAARSN